MDRISLIGCLSSLVVCLGGIACSSNASPPQDETGGGESSDGAGGKHEPTGGGGTKSGSATGGRHSGGNDNHAAGGAGAGATGSTGGVANVGGSSGKGGAAGVGGRTISTGLGGTGAGGRTISTGGGGAEPASGGHPGADAGAGRDSGDGVAGHNAGGAAGRVGGAGGTSNIDADGGGSATYSPCPTNGDPCKILPLGDSITHGLQSSDNGGYRSQLFKLIVAANQNVTFTGSQSSGPDQVSGKTFPKNHEGHDGWTVDPGFSKYGSGGISSLVPSPAFSTTPGIVLLMIGTNDITSTSSPGTTADRLDGLLDKVVAAAPNALVVVAKLTPVNWTSADLNNYNEKIPQIVQGRAAKGQHIVSVDMSKMPTTDLASDGVHPNDQGYAYMANVWYEAIKGVLPK